MGHEVFGTFKKMRQLYTDAIVVASLIGVLLWVL
jgi:hypothetical protein